MKQHFRYGPPMHRVAVHHAKGNRGSRTHTAAPLLKAASFRSSTQTCQMNRTRAPARIGRHPLPPLTHQPPSLATPPRSGHAERSRTIREFRPRRTLTTFLPHSPRSPHHSLLFQNADFDHHVPTPSRDILLCCGRRPDPGEWRNSRHHLGRGSFC